MSRSGRHIGIILFGVFVSLFSHTAYAIDLTHPEKGVFNGLFYEPFETETPVNKKKTCAHVLGVFTPGQSGSTLRQLAEKMGGIDLETELSAFELMHPLLTATSPDGSKLFTQSEGYDKPMLILWDMEKLQAYASVEPDDHGIHSVAFSQNSDTLNIIDENSLLYSYSVKDGKACNKPIQLERTSTHWLVPGGQFIFGLDAQKRPFYLDLTNTEEKRTLQIQEDLTVSRHIITNSNHRVVLRLSDGAHKIYDLQTGKFILDVPYISRDVAQNGGLKVAANGTGLAVHVRNPEAPTASSHWKIYWENKDGDNPRVEEESLRIKASSEEEEVQIYFSPWGRHIASFNQKPGLSTIEVFSRKSNDTDTRWVYHSEIANIDDLTWLQIDGREMPVTIDSTLGQLTVWDMTENNARYFFKMDLLQPKKTLSIVDNSHTGTKLTIASGSRLFHWDSSLFSPESKTRTLPIAIRRPGFSSVLLSETVKTGNEIGGDDDEDIPFLIEAPYIDNQTN